MYIVVHAIVNSDNGNVRLVIQLYDGMRCIHKLQQMVVSTHL